MAKINFTLVLIYLVLLVAGVAQPFATIQSNHVEQHASHLEIIHPHEFEFIPRVFVFNDNELAQHETGESWAMEFPDGTGWGTYYTTIELTEGYDTPTRFTLKTKLLHGSVRVYINSEFIGSNGTPSNEQTSKGIGLTSEGYFFFDSFHIPEDGKLNIKIHLSNWVYYRGGITQTLEIDTLEDTLMDVLANAGKVVFLAALLIIIGMQHAVFGIYNNRSFGELTLYLVFTTLMVFVLFLYSETPLSIPFPSLPIEALYRAKILAALGAIPLLIPVVYMLSAPHLTLACSKQALSFYKSCAVLGGCCSALVIVSGAVLELNQLSTMFEALEGLTIFTVIYVNAIIIHLICSARWGKELLWHCLALALPTIYISAALANDMLVGLNVIQGNVQSQFAVATIAISMGIIFTTRISLEARTLKVDNMKMRARMNEAFLKLDHERTQNVALNINTANTIEEERKSIAQELHDGLSSTIIGSKMAIEHVANTLKSTSPEKNAELVDVLTNAEGQLDIGYKELREFTHKLRPETLKLGGLAGAIRELAATFHSLDVLLDVRIDTKLPEDVDITIYRIIQECLTNTAKHSDAESVEIRVEETSNHYWFTYRDNGSKRSYSADYSTHGMGLTSITNRITGLGSLPLFEDPMGRSGFFLKFSFESSPA